MLKSSLFALACFLLVSIAVGDYGAGEYHSLPKKPLFPPMTASQVCVSRGHDAACVEVSWKICKSLTCSGPDGVVAFHGKAPNGMWCAESSVCRNGQCVVTENHAPPEKNLELVECP